MPLELLITELRQLRLYGMLRSLEEQRLNTGFQSLGFDERLDLLISAEIHDRAKRKQERLQRDAKFRVNASTESIDFSKHRGLDRQVVNTLSTCDWIEKSLNTIIVGPTGVGKTYLACALGQQAVRKGYTVFYKRLSRLLEELEIAYGDGSLPKLRIKLSKADLIILDDWALSAITVRGRQELLELIEEKLGNGSFLITSQLPINQWHDFLGEATLADAILDRLVHRAHRIELHGESMRKLNQSLEVEHVSDK